MIPRFLFEFLAGSAPACPLAVAIAFASAFLIAGCNTRDSEIAPGPTPAVEDLQPPWAGKANPLADSSETIERGRALFGKNCVPCHGANGDGKGPSAAGLQPPPANFLDGVRLASHTDAYLFMRVSTGKHETAMPAFAGTLAEEDRWAILRFLRSLPGAKRREPVAPPK